MFFTSSWRMLSDMHCDMRRSMMIQTVGEFVYYPNHKIEQ